MNEAWKKHIQPILDAWQWDHFSWVFEPFIKYYPSFNEEQRTQVEDAIATTISDLTDEKLALKAIAIAESLKTSHLASKRLCELIKHALQEQIHFLTVDSQVTYYYVSAASTFGAKEAIPFIKSLIDQLEKLKANRHFDERNKNSRSYRELLQKCSSALDRLGSCETN